MKNFLALVLAAIMLAASLTGCAASLTGCAASPQSAAISANIRVTSADAADAAAWLTERLGEVPDRVVIGTDADGHGVDVSALEDDGYFIRSLGGEVAILARTAIGLDRAVRRYAKAIEAGERVGDETYHEGYRIEELRLAGVPIGEYAISVEGGDDYIRGWVTKNAAGAFAELVGRACGAVLAVGGEAEHRIVFREIADESFKESSYHYYFADGDLIFEYVDLGGARNAMVKFLENECGWTDLFYGFDVLCEADLVDVPASVDVLCHPRFGGILHATTFQLREKSTLADVCYEAFKYSFRIPDASHFLGAVWGKYFGIRATGHLVCMTDDYTFECIAEEIADDVDERLAAGETIGGGIDCINIGIEDASKWCNCKACLLKYVNEGGTWAGPMVYFINRLDAALDDAGYEGLKYSVFAYAGSQKPPKTAPSDDVYITYVFAGACTNHCLDGSQCEGKIHPVYDIAEVQCGMGDWLRGWCELAKHVYARPAPLFAPVHGPSLIDQTYDDIVFLTELGIECVYEEMYTSAEFDTNLIVGELWEAMTFDPDMTRAEYYGEFARLAEKYYGDGWRGVVDYIDCLDRAELENPRCWTVWLSYYLVSDAEQFDHATYRALWDRMLDSLALAEREANSRDEEERVKKLRVSAIYNGCYASYYSAYQEHDDERLALLEERWAEMIAITKELGVYERFKKDGLSHFGASKTYPEGDLILDTVEQTAWIGGWRTSFWKDYEKIMALGGYDEDALRPAPEKYAG